MPFMTPDKVDSPPRGFTTSFTVVPLLTYVLATCIVLWIWGISSHYARDYLELTVREFVSAIVGALKLVFGYAKASRFQNMQIHLEGWTPDFVKNWQNGIIENWKYSLNRWKLQRGVRRRRRDQESRI